MRRLPPLLPAAPVLLAPAALAFQKGGYFDGPRLWAGVAAWALVAAVAIGIRDPLPRAAPGRLVLGGIAALTALTGLSLLWAPLGGQAGDDLSRLLLYLAVTLAAVPLLRPPEARRAVEPVVLATTTAAALYGLSERLLPSLI